MSKFSITHNGKHVKYYRCRSVSEANKECREVEREYQLPKYSVNVAYVEDEVIEVRL